MRRYGWQTTVKLLDLSMKETNSINSRFKTAKNSARRYGAEGSHLPYQIIERFREYDQRCYYCTRELSIMGENSFTLDHYIPLSRGGTNYIENIVPACKRCNKHKGYKVPKSPVKGGKEWKSWRNLP